VKLDSSGNTWVTQQGTSRIFKWNVGDCTSRTCNIAPDQTITPSSGNPRGFIIDSSNNMHVAFGGTNVLREYNSAGTVVNSISGGSTGLNVSQYEALDQLPTPTATATATQTAVPTNTPTFTPTAAATATATFTPVPTFTATATFTPVPTATATATATATPSACAKHYYSLGTMGKPGNWGMRLNVRPRGCL